MSKSVKVSANEAGQAITPSRNNPEYGFIRVTQEKATMEGGWLKKRMVSALINGSVEDLKSMGFTAGKELPGKIVVRESLEPFNTEDPDKDLKVAGNTGVVCTVDGAPVYRKTFYTDDVNASDTFVQHTNGEEIKLAYDLLKEQGEEAENTADLGEGSQQ